MERRIPISMGKKLNSNLKSSGAAAARETGKPYPRWALLFVHLEGGKEQPPPPKLSVRRSCLGFCGCLLGASRLSCTKLFKFRWTLHAFLGWCVTNALLPVCSALGVKGREGGR